MRDGVAPVVIGRVRGFACRLLVAWALTACNLAQLNGATPASAGAEPSDAELRQNYGDQVASEVADIRRKHQAALAAPNSLDAADAYADALIAGLNKNYSQINGIDWRKYLKDGADVLGSATASADADGEKSANALAKRASMQYTLGDEQAAAASIRAGFGKAQTYRTSLGMVGLFISEKKPEDAKQLCEKTRPLAKQDDDIYQLLAECLKLNQGETPQQTLPWASAVDWDLYKKKDAERIQRNLARRAAEDEAARNAQESQASGPSQPQGAGRAEPSPSAPKRASFTLRSSCRETVHVFYGQTPKFGSGRSGTVSGNSQQSENMNEGDMIWIVDDSGNGVSSFTASANVHEVVINEQCTGFQAR